MHGKDIQRGYCHCGCGEKTRVATRNDASTNRVKGRPMRFVLGHHPKRARYVEENRGFASPCWIWLGALSTNGYGCAPGGGPQTTAHRWMYQQRYGAVPADMVVDHLCRVRSCVNPDHLEVVTQATNTQRGLSAKLTIEQARAIRADSRRGGTLGRVYGVSRETIRLIQRGETWK